MTDLPKPLRTAEFPDGIPGLVGRDELRVSAANQLYAVCADVFRRCAQLGIACMVENPNNSLFWLTTFWTDLAEDVQMFTQIHQACGYGSQRPKWTRMTATFPQVSTINKTCDQTHVHAPWGVSFVDGKRVFATALEVHYPLKLCKAICQAFMLHFTEQEPVLGAQTSLQQVAAASTIKQTLSVQKISPVPTFANKIMACFLHDACVWPTDFSISPALKLLHVSDLGVNGVKQFSDVYRECLKNELKALNMDSELAGALSPGLELDSVKFFGVQWEPEDFVARAMEAQHPCDVAQSIPSVLNEVIEVLCRNSELEIAKRRMKFLCKWNKRAKVLQREEDELKRRMDPEVSVAVRDKRILVFSEILQELQYPDLGVISELEHGAELVGEVPVTGMLPYRFSPSLMTVEELGSIAASVRPQFNSKGVGSGDSEVDTTVWEQTLQEVSEGWLKGPIPLSDIPTDAPISRRFGIRQGPKIRLIDNFASSQVNDCVTVHESPVLHTVDIGAAVTAAYFQRAKQCSVQPKLQVRTFDLASAYRQIAVNPTSRRFGFIHVYDPTTGEWAFFQTLVLPFGAVRSVHSFLRLARAIWHIGCVGLDLLWTSFYDDFVVMSSSGLCRNAELAVSGLFRLLGWRFAESGKKCVPFDDSCAALGVVFDLSCSGNYICKVANTEKRIAELSEAIRAAITAGKLNKLEAQKLRGRMQFAEGQLYGRTGRRCIRVLSEHAQGMKLQLSKRSSKFLEMFISLLTDAGPRTISLEFDTPMLIFSDACYEKDAKHWKSGIGGVLIDPYKHEKEFFSLELNDEQRAALGEHSKVQLIFEAETLAAVLAFLLWHDKAKNRLSYLFVDNEGTKFCLIRGASDNPVVDRLVLAFCEREAATHAINWIARVPSHSNCSDDPSRGETKVLVEKGFADVSGHATIVLALLMASIVEVGEKAEATRAPT